MGSNPGTVYCKELTFFTLICCKNCIDVCLKKTENRDRGWPIFLKKLTWSMIPDSLNSDFDVICPNDLDGSTNRTSGVQLSSSSASSCRSKVI